MTRLRLLVLVGTNTMVGSDNRDTVQNTTESMIKPWLAADYLNHLNGKPLSHSA